MAWDARVLDPIAAAPVACGRPCESALARSRVRAAALLGCWKASACHCAATARRRCLGRAPDHVRAPGCRFVASRTGLMFRKRWFD